jgi:hypothetical protein
LDKLATCVVCDAKTSGSLDWCRIHYKDYKDEIKGKKPWTRALKNEAQKLRRTREKEWNNVSLDSFLDREYVKTKI